jgi:hypothetical protein
MIFAQSQVMSSYFYPFLSFFVESGFSNPYTFFLESDNKEAFPYPAGMLFLLAIPQIISSFFDLNQAFAIGVLKIPLLLADLGILLITLLVIACNHFHKLYSWAAGCNSYFLFNSLF